MDTGATSGQNLGGSQALQQQTGAIKHQRSAFPPSSKSASFSAPTHQTRRPISNPLSAMPSQSFSSAFASASASAPSTSDLPPLSFGQEGAEMEQQTLAPPPSGTKFASTALHFGHSLAFKGGSEQPTNALIPTASFRSNPFRSSSSSTSFMAEEPSTAPQLHKATAKNIIFQPSESTSTAKLSRLKNELGITATGAPSAIKILYKIGKIILRDILSLRLGFLKLDPKNKNNTALNVAIRIFFTVVAIAGVVAPLVVSAVLTGGASIAPMTVVMVSLIGAAGLGLSFTGWALDMKDYTNAKKSMEAKKILKKDYQETPIYAQINNLRDQYETLRTYKQTYMEVGDQRSINGFEEQEKELETMLIQEAARVKEVEKYYPTYMAKVESCKRQTQAIIQKIENSTIPTLDLQTTYEELFSTATA
ncbi:MAG: hypothetical protein WC860_01720, partial [Candidatus Margulisiibacteriota bacterium]